MRPFFLSALASLSALAQCQGTYDYIIAGGGTAGLVVANRLSADPNVRVAVIEPGGDQRNNTNVTSVLGFMSAYNTSIDWQYSIVPQEGLGGRNLQYHAGKALGGTSTINGMTFIRGDKAEVDAWEALGNEGWNWDVLWPHYKGVEKFTAPTESQIADGGASWNPAFHGEDGQLTTGYPYELLNGTFHDTAKKTWANLGYPHNEDLNGGDVRGFSVFPETLDRDADTREDAARAFLYPVVGSRPNLHIIQGTARKIVWKENEAGYEYVEATGVQYLTQGGDTVVLNASKEVILSAGALRSPLILELSGIGNPSILGTLGIETKVDLPGVGENLVEQPLLYLGYTGETSNGTESNNITGASAFATFVNAQDIFGDNTAALAASTKASLGDWATQLAAASNGTVNATSLEHIFTVQHDLIFNKNVTIGEILANVVTNIYVHVFWPLLPFSRGRVHLQSTEAIDDPLIDPKYLVVDFDVTMMTGLGRVAQHFWNEEPASLLVAEYLYPGSDALPLNATDAQWKDFLVTQAGPNHHALGTAAMMSRELGGVVDPQLKVYGTSNVRVVDASIIPLQISGHLTSTIYAVSDRAADIIIDCA